MEQIVINKNDELIMKLLHYFITEMGYSPIVLHGAKNEIWLENLNGDYQIIRIVSNYIHNNEQLHFDLFRTRQIVKRIEKKTFSFHMNTLSLFMNLGDNVEINEYIHNENIDCAQIKTLKDFHKYEFILESFPTITKKTTFKEKGTDLFLKITGDISKKSEQDSLKAEEVFKAKKPYITYLFIMINIGIFILGHIDINIINQLFLKSNIGDEYYRIITSAFTHYDVFHLLFNMYGLYVIGSQIESFFGRIKYVLIYFFSAITGSLLSLIFTNGIGSLGASGAIFGLFGALLYFGYHYRLYLGTVVKSQIIPLIAINLIYGLINTNIDNAAHMGGLIGGFFMTMALGVKYKSTNMEKLNGIILTIVLTIFLTYIYITGI